MTDLFREAEDELRRETVESTAKKLAPWAIGIAVLALVAGSGWVAWNHFQTQAVAEGNAAIAAASARLNANDMDGGIAALEPLTKSGPRQVRDHATLLRATAIAAKGDNAAALAAFDEAVKSIGNRDLRDVATIRAAYLAADTETREQVAARVKGLVDGEGPLAPLARELNAAMAWAAGDSAAAKAEYELLQLDPNVPEGLRQRAAQALAVIEAGATASTDLMQVAPQPGQGGAAGGMSPEQAQAMARAEAEAMARAQAGGQGAAAGQPGQARGAQAAGQQQPKANQAGGVVGDQFLQELERERAAEESRQRDATRAQQQAVDTEVARRVEEARKAEEAARTAAPAPAPAPASEPPADAPPKEGNGQ